MTRAALCGKVERYYADRLRFKVNRHPDPEKRTVQPFTVRLQRCFPKRLRFNVDRIAILCDLCFIGTCVKQQRSVALCKGLKVEVYSQALDAYNVDCKLCGLAPLRPLRERNVERFKVNWHFGSPQLCVISRS